MTTAQDAYKRMLRDCLPPRLHAAGFRGSGRAYEFPSDSHWIVVGLQSSQFSSAEVVKFTLNCQVVRQDKYKEVRQERTFLGPKPQPNTIAGGFLWHSRIGELMPAGEDHWWLLRPGDDVEALADEVAAAVRDYLLPAIRSEVAATSTG